MKIFDAPSTVAAESWATTRRWIENPRVRAAAYAFAVLLFGAGIALAWNRADIAAGAIDIRFAAAVGVIGVPLQVLFGGLLLRVLARPAGTKIALSRACRIVGLGTLSGVLPAASGTVVRGAALKSWGLSGPQVVRALAVDAGTWAAVALLISGGALLSPGTSRYGLACLGLGTLLGTPAVYTAVSALGAESALRLGGSRLGGILVDLARIWACFAALSHPVGFDDAAALAAAGPLSSLVFFLPGGLGVRELVTAGLAQAAALDPSVAFLAATLNRLLGLLVLGAFELVVAVRAVTSLVDSESGAVHGSVRRDTGNPVD